MPDPKATTASQTVTNSSDNAKSKSKGKHRTWDLITDKMLPLALSTAALMVSILAYIDQHSVNQSVSSAQKRAYANDVSFWLLPASNGTISDVAIQNLGQAPITNVTVDAEIGMGVKRFGPDQQIGIGIIPPCSLDVSNVLRIAVAEASKGASNVLRKQLGADVYSLTFTDTNNMTWVRWASSGLLQRASSPDGASGEFYFPITEGNHISPAHGCA